MCLKSGFVIVAVVASHACNMVFAKAPPESHRTKYNFNYSKLPDYLHGAEYVRSPNKDKGYWARDQLLFLAGAVMDLYVARDDRIPRPEFIPEDYVNTGDDILINNASHSLFRRTLKANESVIMAGDFDKDATHNSNMYVVFAVRQTSEGAGNE